MDEDSRYNNTQVLGGQVVHRNGSRTRGRLKYLFPVWLF